MLTLVLIAGWFFLGIPESAETRQSLEKVVPTLSSREPSSIQPIPQSGPGNGIPPKSDWTHTIPRLLYWCSQCQQQKKFRPKNNADIEKEHPCPTCGTPLLGWWAEPNKEAYIKFMIGLIIFGSGFSTIVFANTFGGYGLYPLIMIFALSVPEVAVGGYIAWKTTAVKLDGPAPYATTTPSKDGTNELVHEMLIFVPIAFVGAMIGLLINNGIVGIFF